MIIGFVSQYFLAHYLTQGEFGELQLILSWITLLSFFSLNSFGTIVLKASAQGYPLFFRRASLICFLFALLGSLVLFVVGFYFESEKFQLFIIAAIFFPFYSGINLAQHYFTGKKEYKKYSYLVILTQILVTSLQVFALLFANSLKLVLLFTLLSTSIINLLITIYLVLNLQSEEKSQKQENELIEYGISLSFINIIPSIAGKIQFIILEAFTTPETLAIYAIAQLLPSRIKSLFRTLIIPFAVHLATKEKNESIDFARKAIILLLLYGLVSTILVSIFLPLFIQIIYGNKYDDSIFYSILLLVNLLFMPTNSIIGSVIIYQGYKKVYAKITTFKSVFSIILYIILIPFFEIYGIIFTVVLLSVFTFLLQIIWLYRLPRTESVKSVLFVNNNIELDEALKSLQISNKIKGTNIMKIIEADYLLKGEIYPVWVKIIAKLSFTPQLLFPKSELNN
jgi:O-antigen/teichoic acid export membrane protein